MVEELLLPLTVVILLCTVLPARSQGELPKGDGKKAVQMYCVRCHDLGLVTRSGYSEQGWRNAIQMVINVGATRRRTRSLWRRSIWRRTSRKDRSRAPC